MDHVNIISISLLLLYISHYCTAHHPTYYENCNWKSADKIGSISKKRGFLSRRTVFYHKLLWAILKCDRKYSWWESGCWSLLIYEMSAIISQKTQKELNIKVSFYPFSGDSDIDGVRGQDSKIVGPCQIIHATRCHIFMTVMPKLV